MTSGGICADRLRSQLPSIESVGAACVLADFYLRQGANAEAMQACEKARLIFDQIRLEAADGDTNAR